MDKDDVTNEQRFRSRQQRDRERDASDDDVETASEDIIHDFLRRRRNRKHNSLIRRHCRRKLETIPTIVSLLTSPRKPKKEAVVEIF